MAYIGVKSLTAGDKVKYGAGGGNKKHCRAEER